jgi:hypothetical protein
MARKPAAPKAQAHKPEPVAIPNVIETVAEVAADEVEDPATEEVDLDRAQAVKADAEALPMPEEISDKVPGMTHEGEVARIDIWMSETRYLIGQLEHDHVGPRGEIIAYLKAKLA